MRDYEAYSEQFEQASIDPADFSHIDHIGVAWTLLGKYEFLDAMVIYSKSIKAIADKAGVPGKFNLTITIAFLSLIAERRKHSDTNDFSVFIAGNEDLLDGNPLANWYSKARLSVDVAREVFLMPDIKNGLS